MTSIWPFAGDANQQAALDAWMGACEKLSRHYADHMPMVWFTREGRSAWALEQTVFMPWADHRFLSRAADLHVRAGEAWLALWLTTSDSWRASMAPVRRARAPRPHADNTQVVLEATPRLVQEASAGLEASGRPSATVIALKPKEAPQALRADPAMPPLLNAPRGKPDDLTRIKGIGLKLQDLLNKIGIYHFWQLADLTPAQTTWLDDKLDFRGRADRERWREQARHFAQG